MEEYESDSLLAPAFEINPSLLRRGTIEAPQDGLEFLANVVLERRKCQEVVAVPVPKNVKFNKKQTVFVKEPDKLSTAPMSLLPTADWQEWQVSDFSQLRLSIAKIYKTKSTWTHHIQCPPVNGNNTLSKWKLFFEKTDPLLELILSMRQFVLEFALDSLIDSLEDVGNGETVTLQTGRWIYAILAAIKLPLTPEVCSSMRNLARACSRIRNKLSLDDTNVWEKVTPLNLFICLIAHYFRQLDLMDK